jgi:hypothetical protein
MLTETFASETPLATEEYAPVSPFAETFQFAPESEDGKATAQGDRGYEVVASGSGLESPFRSESLESLTEAGPSPERGAYQNFVASLYEAEFSEALYEVAAEAAAAVQSQYGELETPVPGEAEQFLERYMAPLVTEAEATFGRLSEQYMQHDISSMSEAELDRLFESMQPSFGHLSPAMENLFGRLWNKVKSVAGGVVDLAKKGIAAVGRLVPLGWLFDKLKAVIRPLLKRVLQMAIGRLPTPLQPFATKLATRLFGETEVEAESYGESATLGESPTVPAGESLAHGDTDTIQREFDSMVASLFFARDEAEGEALGGDFATEAGQQAEDRLGALDTAREQFAREVSQAERGQDLSAQLEGFIPAILAALRVAIPLIGRPRVVNFLAGYLGRLISPYVGATIAGPLSNAIVSTGMTMMGLEVPPERNQLAGEAVASAVEGTVRRVVEQGEQAFEDQRMLEAVVQEAFAEAAAESFPPPMIREQYHETSGRVPLPGTWVMRPHRGPRRYKRYTQALEVKVTRQMAQAVEVFGAHRLGAFLHARFGVQPPVTMKAYLYEAVPGTTLAAIARHEKRVAGLGPTSVRGWRLFVPLTRRTAGILFGEPQLGRDTASQFLMTPRRIAVGQRFVVLVPEGWRPTAAGPGSPAVQGEVAGHRSSEANLTLDFPHELAKVFIYLSEADAQAVAASVRRGESVTPVLVLLRKIYVAALRSMLSGHARRHVKVVHEVATEAEAEGGVLGAIGERVLNRIVDKVVTWVGRAVSDYFTRRGQEFLTAADNRADGVTIVVTLRHTGVMQLMRRGLRGDGVGSAIALARALLVPADASVRTVPGFRS